MRRATLACAWAFNTGLTSAVYLTATAALLVPGLRISATAAIACVAFYWMMYLVDRVKPAPEDGAEDGGAASFMRARRGAFLALLALTVAAQVACYMAQPRLLLAAGASIAISLAYLVPIPGVGKRVKELPGCKPPYLGFTIALVTGAFVWADGSPPTLIGIVLVAINLTVNTAAYDLKDADADRRAGLPTLAVVLGPRFFPTLHALNLASVVIAWLFAPTPTAVIATLLAAFYVLALAIARRRTFCMVMAALGDTLTAAIFITGWLLF